MKNKNKIYAIATSFIILAIIISIAIPLQNIKNEVNPILITKENNVLPKLENFEGLYNIAIKQKQANEERMKNDIVDYVEEDETTGVNDEETSKDYSETNTQVKGVD